MTEKKFYKISELAREFGVTPRTIRYYEEIGLLSSQRNSPTSHRLYDARERNRLMLILRGKRFGYSLSEMGEILNLYDVDPTQVKQIVRVLEYGIKHLQEIDEKIEELEKLREEMLGLAISFFQLLASQEEDYYDEETRGFIAAAREIVESMHRDQPPNSGHHDTAGKK